MVVFYHVVQQGSFSKAAQRLDVSKSHISKMITKLEKELNTKLVLRNTRNLRITEAGKHFYEYCAQIVDIGEESYAMISERSNKPSGMLKISIAPVCGIVLSHMLPNFTAKYPEISLDIRLETAKVDLLKEGYDLVIRAGVLESSNLIAQKIGNIKFSICATKKYFDKYGFPDTPQDLTKHNVAIYRGTKLEKKLIFDNYEEIINLTGNLGSNHLGMIKQYLLGDTCLCVMPEYMIFNEINDGLIVRCLDNYKLPSRSLYAIYLERNLMLPKLKVFLSELRQQMDDVDSSLIS